MALVSRGFRGRRRQPGAGLVPPGQYLVDDFPVRSGPSRNESPSNGVTLTVAPQHGNGRLQREDGSPDRRVRGTPLARQYRSVSSGGWWRCGPVGCCQVCWRARLTCHLTCV